MGALTSSEGRRCTLTDKKFLKGKKAYLKERRRTLDAFASETYRRKLQKVNELRDKHNMDNKNICKDPLIKEASAVLEEAGWGDAYSLNASKRNSYKDLSRDQVQIVSKRSVAELDRLAGIELALKMKVCSICCATFWFLLSSITCACSAMLRGVPAEHPCHSHSLRRTVARSKAFISQRHHVQHLRRLP